MPRRSPPPAALGAHALAIALFGLGACTGSRGGAAETEDDDGGTGDLEGLECDPSIVPDALPLRRLSRRQLHNTVHDLARFAAPGDAEAVLAEIEHALARFPEDDEKRPAGTKHGGFRRLDQAVHQSHIDAAHEIGMALGRSLTASPARMGALMGDCATNDDAGDDEACVVALIERFGARAHRRPLSEADVQFYIDVFVGDGITGLEPAAIADVIAVMVASPRSLYLVEAGAEAVDDKADAYWLDDYELASRLSYHLWQTAPDDELYAAAASGELSTDEGWRAQVERAFADPRTRATLEEFYREWLWLDDVPAMDARVGTPVFDAFRGDFLPTAETSAHMVQEVLDMALWYTLDEGGTFDDMLLSDRSFATTDDVAQIYGVPLWDGGDPPRFSEPERVGLHTRAALLATGSANTRPVMKGVFLRQGLLCDAIPPPPDNAAASPPELSAEKTTRQVVEELTEGEGSACAGCHATLINPLGFATEGFDALGRARTEQVLFGEDGTELGRAPVDTTSVPLVELGSDVASSGPADLARLLAESDRPHVCLARNWVRFSLGRLESDENDGCMIEDIAVRLTEGDSLAEALRQVALRPEFRQRKIEE
jgi:hypothetical protein